MSELAGVEQEASKVAGWGVAEVLHWLVDEITAPHGTKSPHRATAADVHEAIDAAHAPAPPAPAPAPEPEDVRNDQAPSPMPPTTGGYYPPPGV